MLAAAMSLPSEDNATAMIGVSAASISPHQLAGGRQQIDLAIGAGRDDLAVGRDCHGIERRRQLGDDRRAVRQRPDPQGRVVAGADQGTAIGREGDAVDVLLVPLKHACRTSGEVPNARGVIPGRRRQHGSVGRDRERHHRRGVALEHRRGLLLAAPPDRDAGILAAGRDPAIGKESHRVDRAVMEAQHLRGRVCLQRPADRGGVEAARDGHRAVGRDGQRAHRPAMATQLRLRGRKRQSHERESNEDAEHHRDFTNDSGIGGAHAEARGFARARSRRAIPRERPAPRGDRAGSRPA